MPRSEEPNQARRRFLKTVGLAGLTSALAPAAGALAQAPGAGAPIYPPGVQPPKTAPPGPDARALADIIKRRYGKHLTHEQLESVASDFDGDLKAAKRLHDVKLTNGDEPDVTFRP